MEKDNWWFPYGMAHLAVLYDIKSDGSRIIYSTWPTIIYGVMNMKSKMALVFDWDSIDLSHFIDKKLFLKCKSNKF